MVGLPVHQLVPTQRRAARVRHVQDYLADPQRRYMARQQLL